MGGKFRRFRINGRLMPGHGRMPKTKPGAIDYAALQEPTIRRIERETEARIQRLRQQACSYDRCGDTDAAQTCRDQIAAIQEGRL